MGKHYFLKKIATFLKSHPRIQSLCTIIGILFIAYLSLKCISFYNTRLAINKQLTHLIQVAQSRGHDVNQAIDNEKKCLQSLAGNSAIKKLFETKINSLDQKFLSKILSSAYPQAKNIMGITLLGEMFFSLHPKKDLGTNFINGPYRHSILGESFSRSIMTLTTDISEFGIYKPYESIALFICSPVFSNNQLTGVIVSEVDMVTLQELVNNYQGLGETGETPVGTIRNDSLIFINNKRHALKRFSEQAQLINNEELPLYRACLGETKSTISHDYRNEKVVAHWQLIPQVEWGIVAKSDLQEITTSIKHINTFSSCLLIVILCLLLLAIIINLRYLIPKKRSLNILAKKRLLIFGIGVSTLILIGSLYRYHYNITQANNNLSTYVQKKSLHASRQIQTILTSISHISDAITDDIKEKRLYLEDIPIRLSRDIIENKHVKGIYLDIFTHDNKTINQKYSAILNDNKIIHNRNPSSEDLKLWHRKAVDTKDVWLDPQHNSITNKKNSVYLYTEKINTTHSVLIVIIYSNELIRELINDINIGRMGYSFLLADNGRLLHHPIEIQVTQKRTLLDVANRIDSKSAQILANKIQTINEGFIHIKNEKTAQLETTFITKIPSTNWKLALAYTKKTLPISSQKIRQLHLAIFGSILLLILLAMMLLTKIYEGTFNRMLLFSFCYTGLMIISIFIMWRIVAHTESDARRQGVMTTDIVGLKKFITEIERNAQNNQQEAPVTIPTGILIHSLIFSKNQTVDFTCYVWQRYHDEHHKNIERKPLFPQATKITIEELYRTRKGKEETIGWYIRGTLSEQHSFSKYPFDTIQLPIILSHQALDHHIMLLPDLASYATTNPKTKPGLMSNLSIAGFDIKSSFFNYLPIVTHATLGLDNYSPKEQRYTLHFNALFKRRLINAFIVYLLPLLVILFSIFSVFSIICRKDISAMKPISIYSALFFAAIILHRNLRSSLPTSEIMYIEYFFFYIYITILVFVIHVMISSSFEWFERYQKKVNDFLYLGFWPLQVTAWFITTLFVFY